MKTEAQRQELLIGIGLDPQAGAKLPARPAPTTTTQQPVALAPEGVDPHTMPVADIVFDPALLDGIPDLRGQGYKDAYDRVFPLYKSPPRTNKDRNRRLHEEVGRFIHRVRISRQGVPVVKEVIRKEKPQRDLLAVLAEMGITSVDDLTALLPKGES